MLFYPSNWVPLIDTYINKGTPVDVYVKEGTLCYVCIIEGSEVRDSNTTVRLLHIRQYGFFP